MRPSVLTARATTRPTDLTASARRSLGSRTLLPNAHSAPLSYGCLLSVAEVSRASHLCMRGCHGSHKLGAPIRTGVEPLPPDCLAAVGFDVDALVVGGAALHGCQRAGHLDGAVGVER